jgi:hypothetical protein
MSSTRVLSHRSESLLVSIALLASLLEEEAPATLRLASRTAHAMLDPRRRVASSLLSGFRLVR